MPTDFKLPDVGEGVAEGELVKWLVEEGDAVEEDQPVAEVETDKAVVDVPSPYDGTVATLHWDEGDIVPVGDVFITYNVAGEDAESESGGAEAAEGSTAAEASEADAELEAAVEEPEADETEGDVTESSGRTFAPPSVRRLARELGVDIEVVEGSGPSGRVTEGDVRQHAEGGADVSEAGSEPAESGAEAGGPEAAVEKVTEEAADATGSPATGAGAGAGAAPEAAEREKTLAAPATRKVAGELGVDLNAVPAIEERDGESFVTEDAVRQYAEATKEAKAGEVEARPETPAEGERETTVPYRGVRRTIAKKMAESKYTAPHVTHHDTTAIPDLVDVRQRLKPKAEERGVKLTYMPFVLKAIVAALKDHPELNAELREDEEVIVQKHYYNIGIAVATDAGLMVPVVKNVDKKGMLELAQEVNELAQKARDRTISVEEMQGGTFTVTNFGAIGGEYATPIINYPEVGILGLGAIEERPVVEKREIPQESRSSNGEVVREAQRASRDDETPSASRTTARSEVVAQPTLPISVSIDHRVVDGADVAQFGNEVLEYLNNPELLLLE